MYAVSVKEIVFELFQFAEVGSGRLVLVFSVVGGGGERIIEDVTVLERVFVVEFFPVGEVCC